MAAIPAIDKTIVDYFKTSSSSIVTDSLTRFGLGAWMDNVLPANASSKLAGRVRTVQLAPRSGVKHSTHSFYTAAELFDEGDIMVIGANGGRGWLLGENIAHFCLYQGLGGIVTDGRIRDIGEIRELPFPVFARGSTARPSLFEIEVVAIDVPIECGGAYIRPGDLIVGDADGVVVAPNEAAEPLVAEAMEMVELETRQEHLIRDRAPLSAVQEISRLKKVRKGPALTITLEG